MDEIWDLIESASEGFPNFFFKEEINSPSKHDFDIFDIYAILFLPSYDYLSLSALKISNRMYKDSPRNVVSFIIRHMGYKHTLKCTHQCLHIFQKSSANWLFVSCQAL